MRVGRAGDGVEWSVEQDGVDVEVTDVGDELAREIDGAVGQFAQPAETVITDRHGDQRPRPPTHH